ncbi:MAG: pitrilysin family protein [bacterium]
MKRAVFFLLFFSVFLRFHILSACAQERDTVSRNVLPNGLVALFREEKSRGIVAVEVFIKVGLEQEDDPHAGITNLIQSLLVKGTRELSGQTMQSRLETSGTFIESRAEPDYALISVMTTRSDFRQMLRLLSDLLRAPLFDQKELEKDRQRLIDELDSQKGGYKDLYEIFLQSFYRYHPYRLPRWGYSSSVKQLNRESLLAFYRNFYVSNRMVVSIVGDLEKSEALDAVSDYFKDFKPGAGRPLEITWEPPKEEQTLSFSVMSNLSMTMVGYPAPDVRSPDYPAMKILHTVLGSGLGSRLWLELREKRGLSYDLGSFFPALEGPSHFVTYVVSDPQNSWECRRRILREIKNIKASGITADELKNAKEQLAGQYLLDREICKDQAFAIGEAEILNLSYRFDINFPGKIEAVTLDDVRRVAQTYLVNPLIIETSPMDMGPQMRIQGY